jgi:hypothetical protein
MRPGHGALWIVGVNKLGAFQRVVWALFLTDSFGYFRSRFFIDFAPIGTKHFPRGTDQHYAAPNHAHCGFHLTSRQR